MADRYIRLFTLENGLYAPDAPVMIAAGTLLKDNYSANALAQLKYINLGEEPVSALRVSICMLSAEGEPLGNPLEYQYTGLNAGRDTEFGRNVAIVLPKEGVRSFTVSLLEVQFESGALWSPAEDTQWIAVARHQLLEESLGSKDLADQYRIRYGNDCKYAPGEAGAELWYCTCGAVNPMGEQKCRACRRTLSAMKTVNIENLRSQCEDRLKVEREEEAAGKAEARIKNKKLLRIASVAVPVLILAVILLITVPPRAAKMRAYSSASSMLTAGQYDEAAAAFTALGDYRDSVEQASMNVPYMRAMHMMDLARTRDEGGLAFIGKRAEDVPQEEYGDGGTAALLYQTAQTVFKGLGEYKNSVPLSQQCQTELDALRLEKQRTDYTVATKLLEAGMYSQAREAFLALGDFEDSADMTKEAVYQKALRLYGFTEKYKVRYLYSKLSADAGTHSVFSISTERALEIGSDAIGELRDACGGDGSDIRLEDGPTSDLRPMLKDLEELFASLGDYKDSQDYAEKLRLAQDYTRPFFQLCEEGDVYGAYDWLMAYEEEFDDRERWLELLELYKTFCGTWTLYSGDPTLVPMSAGAEGPCKHISTGVTVALDQIVLHIRSDEDPAFHVELHTDPESLSFVNDSESGVRYYSNISIAGRLAYMKYYTTSDGMAGSCDYTRD